MLTPEQYKAMYAQEQTLRDAAIEQVYKEEQRHIMNDLVITGEYRVPSTEEFQSRITERMKDIKPVKEKGSESISLEDSFKQSAVDVFIPAYIIPEYYTVPMSSRKESASEWMEVEGKYTIVTPLGVFTVAKIGSHELYTVLLDGSIINIFSSPEKAKEVVTDYLKAKRDELNAFLR